MVVCSLHRQRWLGLVLTAFVIAFLMGGSPIRAQVAASTAFSGVAVAAPPPVTGSFDDLASPIWKAAFRTTAFRNFTTRGAAANPTEAYLVFGPDAIYCAFDVTQSTGSITAKQTTNANNVGLGLDDYVAFMVDTSGNGSNQYFFFTTPMGLRYQQATESTQYFPAWTARAAIAGNRWLGEMVIPYRFLRASSRDWRINFARSIASDQQTYTWAFDTQMTNPYAVVYWPRISNAPALAASKAKPSAQIYGLASAGSDRNRYETTAGSFSTVKSRSIGIDAKVPITASLNFDATLNPDFSGLENDQQVITPQEFRRQYSEYRPFFTQGANYLPGNEVFYTPSIGIFDHGEKVEGQIGHVGVGLLDVGTFGASDRAYAVNFTPSNQETTVGFNGAQAQRVNGTDSVNELVLTDTNKVTQINYGALYAIESGAFVQDPAQAHYAIAFGGVSKPNYSLNAAYYDLGPTYAPLDAYLPTNDIRGPQIAGSLMTTTNATAPIRQASVYGYADRYLDHSGAVHEADLGITGAVTFHDLLRASLGTYQSSLRSYLDNFPSYTDGTTSPYDQTTAAISYRSGTPDTASISYSWGQYPSYYLHQVNASASHRFSRRYSAEFDYGLVDQPFYAGIVEGQVLRRVSVFGSLSPEETLNLAYRTISGNGGFSQPGRNLAVSYFRRFSRGSTVQAEIGSPAAAKTLNRFAVKYVLFLGSGASAAR